MEEGFEKVIGFASHFFLLPSLSNTLPLFEETCKPSAQFIHRCLFSSFTSAQSVVLHSRPYHWGALQVICFFRNMCIFCKMFNWQGCDFIPGTVSMSQQYLYFIRCHHHRLSDLQRIRSVCCMNWLNVRDLVFSGDFNFKHSNFRTLINYMSPV